MSAHIVVALVGQAEAGGGSALDSLGTLLPAGTVLTALTTIFVIVMRKGSEGEDRRDKWALERVQAANEDRDRFKDERDAERALRLAEADDFAAEKRELWRRVNELQAMLWEYGINPNGGTVNRDDNDEDATNG